MRSLATLLLIVLVGCAGSTQTVAHPTSTTVQWGTAVEAYTPTTAPPTTAARPRQVYRAASVTVPTDATWERLRSCECPSGWHCNTGNGYFGGLQMDMAFWRGYGGEEFASHPHLASREQQIVVAVRGWSKRGFSPWPTCRRRLGL